MEGNFSSILPDSLSEESERILRKQLEDKLTGALQLSLDIVNAMEAKFGPEAREVVRDMIHNKEFAPRENPGDPAADLHSFCDALDRACVGSHRWERCKDTPESVQYRYTSCLWAKIFNKLGEPEIGFYYCAGDEPGVKAYNPKLGFARTKVLMNGDDHCDHHFFVKK